METVTVPKKDWDTLVRGVADIRNALAGSEELGTTGLIQEVKEHRKVIDKYEAMKNQGKGIAITVGAIWIVLTVGIPIFFSWWFSKH